MLSLEEARIYFSLICSALGHAHQRGLVHRDVKPSNIILGAKATTCYLVDFGIALQANDLTLTGSTPIGTAGYMSPEQERGEDVSPASDVFALGVVLYECLSGGRPPVGGYRPLAIHNEAIPPGVDQLIQSTLQAEARHRPQTAADFLDRLVLALRPHETSASTLDEGSLHEVKPALSQMTTSDFASLPLGQRVVIMTRLRDLVNVDKDTMRRAVAAFLAEVVRLSHTDGSTPYEEVVKNALVYGYEKRFGETWQGDAATRTALNEVALTCTEPTHIAVSSRVLELVADPGLADRAGWYFHDLRILLQKLLINPASGERAVSLGEALTRVNELSH